MTDKSGTPGEGLDPKAVWAAIVAFGAHRHTEATREYLDAQYRPAMNAAIHAYLAASPSVIGSDTAGLPSDRAGLVSWLEEVTSCGCIEPERFDEAAEAIAALSRTATGRLR